MIFDCETATLPYASNFSENDKKKIAIAKPLIYDFGYTIADRKGKIYIKKNWLIIEIFSVPSIFNTAYYAHKRPLYIEKLRKGEIKLASWYEVTEEFVKDLEQISAVGAYNSMFDYKKAIPFTENYINALYSSDFHKWLKRQEWSCDEIVKGSEYEKRKFNPYVFNFRGKSYELFDLWGLTCKHILNCDKYRKQAQENNWYSSSGKYYSTTAENCYRFLNNNFDFEESHTAIDDCEIETEIFAKIFKKPLKEIEMGIIYFPFRIVGKVEGF